MRLACDAQRAFAEGGRSGARPRKLAPVEGGLRVPMVISGRGIENLGIVDSRSQVADITPTLLAFAGVNYDSEAFYGRSWKPLLQGQTKQIYDDTDSFAFEVSGAAAL